MQLQHLSVKLPQGAGTVIAIVRDLRGFRVIVWQDRQGNVGAMMAEGTDVRIQED